MKVGLYIYANKTISGNTSLTVDTTTIKADSTAVKADATVLIGTTIEELTPLRIELYEDEKISVTSSIQNINDISKVFTDYSQTFTVPASNINNSIFKYWYENALNNGFDQRITYNGYIEIDTQIFRTGKWQLEGANIKDNRPESYRLTFYGNLKSLSDKFGEYKLKDLDYLNTFSYDYSGVNVQNSITTSTSQDVMFPLISSNRVWQYGGGGAEDISQNSHHIHYGELFPAVRIARIFDAIENKLEINFTGSFLNQSRFTDAYMWFKNKEVFVNAGQKKLLTYTSITNGNQGMFINSDGNINMDLSYYLTTPSSTYWVGGTVDLTLSISCNWNLLYYKNGVQIYNLNGVGTNVLGGIPDSDGIWQIYLQTNVPVTYTGTVSGTEQYYDETNNSYNNYPTEANTSGTTDAVLDLTALAPDIKLIDFFNGVLKMFNLTAYSYDEVNYTLQQIESWYGDGKIKDYSLYCTTDFDYDRIKAYKNIKFEYEKCDSFMNRAYYDANSKEYGFLNYPFNNDGSDYSVKIPFEHILFNEFSGTKLQVAYSLNKDFKPYIPKPVILYRLKNQTSDVSFYFNNGSSTNHITNYNVFGAESIYLNDRYALNFGSEFSTYDLTVLNNTLFKNYYLDYFNNLYSIKSRMVKVTMRLPYSEMLRLRLNDRIVIRDKRYIINQYTTDFDTFETKFELIQDFRNVNFNNSGRYSANNTAQVLKFYTSSSESLTWSVLNDPTGAIISITNNDDNVEVSIKANTSGSNKTYSIKSNLDDIIIITQYL